MEITLRNKNLQATLETLGAELWSLRNLNTGIEYIWQGDPQYWSRHAPVLFPIVGRLKNNEYRFDGVSYQLPQHGFARDMEFMVREQQADSAVFELNATDETLSKYPFRFRLRIKYQLKDSSLKVSYEVQNLDHKEMFFSLGAHPGFRIPLAMGETYEDYYVSFEQPETLQRDYLADGLLMQKTEPVHLLGHRELNLSHKLFENDALVFRQFNSQQVELRSRAGQHGIRLHFKGWPQLGIWAKPGAQFVCIEPWHGHADFTDHNGQLESKAAILKLAPDTNFQASYSIEAL